jgi:glucan endo-1,3-alpha-glucosidase
MGGLQKLRLPLEFDCNVSAQIYRSSSEDSKGGDWTGERLLGRSARPTLNFEPAGFRFSRNPPNYNFNAFVAASP